MDYVIIETGGKQFRVSEGAIILVEKLNAEVGDSVVFERVLLASKQGVLQVGNPYLQGITVTGKVQEQGKHKKLYVFKYKAKSNYRRRTGHRQPFTKVSIAISGL
ncbi:MAG: 50S ribosomal protein L21 [Symbiobacteriaceae bacterium]|nr:50S ribosomal protein L21 [Symbiobacteriaceae bacterium]